MHGFRVSNDRDGGRQLRFSKRSYIFYLPYRGRFTSSFIRRCVLNFCKNTRLVTVVRFNMDTTLCREEYSLPELSTDFSGDSVKPISVI